MTLLARMLANCKHLHIERINAYTVQCTDCKVYIATRRTFVAKELVK